MVTISPSGLNGTALTANQVSLLASYSEKLCRTYCVNSTLQPQYSIVYSYGTPVLNETTVFVPITAIITIVTPGSRNCNATTQLYTEKFMVSFQGQTALPKSVAIASVGRTSNGSNVKCCRTKNYSIHDSLTITIA